MVDVQSFVNLVTWNTQVAAFVSGDDSTTDLSPFSGRIELLIEISVEPEGGFSDSPAKSEVIEAVFDRRETSQLTIPPNHSPRTLPRMGCHQNMNAWRSMP